MRKIWNTLNLRYGIRKQFLIKAVRLLIFLDMLEQAGEQHKYEFTYDGKQDSIILQRERPNGIYRQQAWVYND